MKIKNEIQNRKLKIIFHNSKVNFRNHFLKNKYKNAPLAGENYTIYPRRNQVKFL